MVEVALQDPVNGGLVTARLIGGRWEVPGGDPVIEQHLNAWQRHEASGPLPEEHAIEAIKFFDRLPGPSPRRRGRILRVELPPLVPGRVY